MKTKLVSMRKLDRNNTECMLKCDDGREQKMIFWKYTREQIINALRETCNCTVAKEFC